MAGDRRGPRLAAEALVSEDRAVLWQSLPAPALRRLRSSRSPAYDTAPRAQLLERHVLNVLGALRIANQELRLFRGEDTEPHATRVVGIDEGQRCFHLAASTDKVPPSIGLPGESGSLFGPLGHVWMLMPCQLLGLQRLGEATHYRAEMPGDVLYLQARRKPRVATGLGLSALWPGSVCPQHCRVHDLSEEGVGFEVPSDCADWLRPGERIPNALFKQPQGSIAAIDLEIVHVRDTGGRRYAGARFRPAGRADRIRLRRLLRQQSVARAGAEPQLADAFNRSIR